MESEREKTERGRKNGPVGIRLSTAAEAMRDAWERERLSRDKKARLSTILYTENYEVTHDQLCDFLKYAILGQSGVPTPSWCQLFHQNYLKNVVIFVLQGMSQLHFYRFYLEFTYLRKAFGHKFRLPSPSSDFLAEITGLQKKKATRDLSKTSKASLPSSASSNVSVNLQNHPIIRKYGSKKVGVTKCLLTKEEMETFRFPLQGFPDCENFVSTKRNGSVTDSSPLFGLDCEMCLTAKGRELTRVALVAEGGDCIMDELVKPDNKILDYLTSQRDILFLVMDSPKRRHDLAAAKQLEMCLYRPRLQIIIGHHMTLSGITKMNLDPVTTKLKDVQRKLKALLPASAVLVGHSLDLDLKALRMIHPYVIDTSLLYVREQGRRFKLKFLAKAILGKDIQNSDRRGHDATEDARTALELAQYFLQYGPKKVAQLNLEAVVNRQKLQAADQEPSGTAGTQQPNASVLDCLHSAGQKLLLLTREAETSELSSSRNCQTVTCLSNKEVLEQARVAIPLFPFSIVQFSFEGLSPALAEEMNHRLIIKWTEMSTIYAGPFSKTCNIAAVNRLFKSFGPVRSSSRILETHQPHLCVQYEVLEAAQLAIESLNGTVIDGCRIQVQRPVTELTLDCDTLLNELEQDSDNRGAIYLSGVREGFKEHLLRHSSLLFGLEAVIMPKDFNTGKQKSYCFLKFKTICIAQMALKIFTGDKWKLKGRHALTPRHLNTWLQSLPPESTRSLGLQVESPSLEQQALQIMNVDHQKITAWSWGRKIGELYHGLCPGTLCLILLPGTKSAHGSLPGLGLMGIKSEEESIMPDMCL